MRRHRRYLLAALLSAAATPALGQSLGMGLGLDSVDRPDVGAVLDGFASPAAAYSMRKLRSGYTGPAIRIRRASDNAETDIGFLGFTSFTGAPLDVAAANAHCAATTCTVAKWYDQSGGNRDGDRVALPVNQPAFVFNCIGTQPCVRVTAASLSLATAASYTPVLPVTFSAVANRSVGAGACQVGWQYVANNDLQTHVAGQWAIVGGGGGFIAAAAADAQWHAGIGIVNGASSVLRIDATETTGTAAGATGAGVIISISGADGSTCSATEIVLWSGYGLSPAERVALTANQASFWGF